MKKRKFPIVNIALLAVIIVVFGIMNKNKSIPDESNCSYIINDEVVKLVDGRSDVEIVKGAASRRITDFIVSQGGPDLNGDRRSDSAVFLKQQTGGSGTFYYIAAAFGNGHGYDGSKAFFLGDRIEPVDISFDGENIIVIYKDRPEGDSFSKRPSVEVLKKFKVIENEMVEVPIK